MEAKIDMDALKIWEQRRQKNVKKLRKVRLNSKLLDLIKKCSVNHYIDLELTPAERYLVSLDNPPWN